MSRKIGFWPVFALVTGSQIGSGVFMLPASLAPYGGYSLLGWIISGLGAIALALVFAQLCNWIPKTGGPHAYVQEAFGSTASFFVGWTYWVISWVSTTAVIVTSIGYLGPIIGVHSTEVTLLLEILLVLLITALNLRGIKAAGSAEFILTALKIIPLVLMPLAAFMYFNAENIAVAPAIESLPAPHILSQVTLLTLWGFVGLESATTPAQSVVNPEKTIPRAIILGTISVAILYFFNSLGILGVIPSAELANTSAPYSAAAQYIFGGNWHLMISLIASIVCIGTLNAWMLASGQIALGLSEDGLMPRFFSKKNKFEAPYMSLLISCAGIIPLLMLTADKNLAQQMTTIIDFSVVAFLFVYLSCCLSFLKLLPGKKMARFWPLAYGIAALLFCSWVIYETSLATILVASLFTLCGIPVYFYRKHKGLM